MNNDFIWTEEKYQQNINPVKQYIDQAATFLSIQRGINKEEASKFVVQTLKDKEVSRFSDPPVVFFERDENWIKNLKTGTLSGYLKSAINNQEVIVPTLTTYVSPNVEQSLVSVFMKRNAGRRGVLKKKAQVEEQRGNSELAYQYNNLQDNAKRNNNSLSGSMAAAGSIFENPTGHNTLTSITRSMSSISNALNEKMISGNRHYMDPDTAINNMTVIAQTMDEEAVNFCIEHYKLHVPTPEEIGEIVKKSADKYWRDRRHINVIVEYASKMTPAQRTAFAYTQDLFHVRKLNPDFMVNFINDFAKPDTTFMFDDPAGYIDSIDPLIANYAHQIFISKLRGADKDRRAWKPELVLAVAQACATIVRAIAKYKAFIDAFLVVKSLPCETAYINQMSRESVVLSDTDSTMFSVDEWVIWYFGDLLFNDFAFAVSGSIMFVSTQLIAHAMALLSANMNVARDKLFVLAMKPEFVFPVFAQTPVAKHYFASMSVKEGAVYEENKYEIKGVHLKSSAVTYEIVGASQNEMRGVLDDVEKGLKLDQYKYVSRVADLERAITESIRNGESRYLKRIYIKTPSSYSKGPTESPYRFHTLWNQVFGPSYSDVDEAPYVALKLPMLTESKKKMNDWIDGFEDRTLADRYRKYLAETGRTEIKTMYISKDYVDSYGIPREIQRAINIKKMILDLTGTDRLVLTTLGFFPKAETTLMDMGY